MKQLSSITLPDLGPTIVHVPGISSYGGLAMFLESVRLDAGHNSRATRG